MHNMKKGPAFLLSNMKLYVNLQNLKSEKIKGSKLQCTVKLIASRYICRVSKLWKTCQDNAWLFRPLVLGGNLLSLKSVATGAEII